ncbi:MAG: hypothetical protein EAX89_10000 [Candidatus Lokiarchaeota archaeon]|nr:hypothetical protein [Candidatus Lokiarchaeota archaeon]
MKKSKIPHKLKKAEVNTEDQEDLLKNPKIEILSKISDLKNIANSSLLETDYDNAIKYSEKIIRLAIKHNMNNQIKEQQNFITLIAEKVQRDYFLSEINKTVVKIHKIYNILAESNNFTQAHDILETFINNYKEKINIDQLPQIKALIEKDKKEWVKYQIDS